MGCLSVPAVQVTKPSRRKVECAFVFRSQNWKKGICWAMVLVSFRVSHGPLSDTGISLNLCESMISLSSVTIAVSAPGLEGLGASSPVLQQVVVHT